MKVVWEQNGSSYDETTHTFVNGQYGQTGWTYSDGIDLSAYKYLVVKLKEPDNNGTKIFIYPQSNIWANNNYEQAFNNRTQIVVPLHTMKSKQTGSAIDPSKIYIVALWSFGGKPITIDDIYVTNNSDYSPMTGISVQQSHVRPQWSTRPAPLQTSDRHPKRKESHLLNRLFEEKHRKKRQSVT